MKTLTAISGRPRWLCGLLGAGVLVVGATGLLLYAWRREPAPAIASNPFLNTRPDVRYVGSAACHTCHAGEHASFGRTGMGRSMARVDLQREPPDATYDHAKSKRRYQVVRRDGEMLHREWLLTGGPEEVLLSEYPVKYVVGSGRHSLTYLVEADGFLVESPVTWYTSKQGWGMSPGYDRAEHAGFERAVGESCLICHTGEAHSVDNSVHRMRIPEPVIGCERCHGPGALHVERHAPPDEDADRAIDCTIVNPAHLSRELAEAICQQCHLRSSASVVARGKTLADFRPGLPLEDFRHDFRLQTADSSMTVVGHVEQMHLSRCYKGSRTFSCLTCHNPHDEPAPEQNAARYNSVCRQCHAPERCKVDPHVRQQRSPGNNCILCHMPAAPTEIPHLAFTHHRVGIHDLTRPLPAAEGRLTVLTTLEPFLDLSRVSDLDRARSLGMGYLEVVKLCKDSGLAEQYRNRALDLLTTVRSKGLPDGAVDAALARLRFDAGVDGAAGLAESALAAGSLDPQDRCNALFLLAEGLAQAGKHRDAIPMLRELATLRRHHVQMLLLADCERAVGDPGYIQTLENAVRINPRLAKVHAHLAEHFRQKGDAAKADFHRKRVVP